MGLSGHFSYQVEELTSYEEVVEDRAVALALNWPTEWTSAHVLF